MNAELNRRIENIIRFGTIAEVDLVNARAKVNSGGIRTDWLPWLAYRAGTTKTWSPPTEGEQCIILAASGELTTAVILSGLYTQNSPSRSADEHLIEFADGATLRYNQASGTLYYTGMQSFVIDCPQITINGDIQLNGVLSSSGDQIAGGISIMNHTHQGDSGGRTGKPS
ncbi:phage baseplate assembly protein V [Pasteurellaceae bacterium LIM206]|nr:phage baseplate assembly protein V [Pasteurellaceae bacterium LIM206]